MVVGKSFIRYVRYRKVCKVHRISQDRNGKLSELVVIGSTLKKHKLKAKFAAFICPAMTGVIPPFGLSSGLCKQVLRQSNKAVGGRRMYRTLYGTNDRG